MGYVFLIIACFAGISKAVAMKSCGKICPGEYNSVRINTFRSLICGIVSVAIFLISGSKTESQYWWIWLLSGLSNALMMFVWILCTQHVGLVFVETFCLIGSTAIPMIIAPLLYAGETVSVYQWIGVACLLLAVLALSIKPKEKTATGKGEVVNSNENKKEKFSALTVLYILLLILSNVGLSVTTKLYPSRAGDEYTAFFNLMTFVVVLACFSLVLTVGKIRFKKTILPENTTSNKKLAIFVCIAAAMIYLYQYCSTLAAGLMDSAIFYPLSKGISMCLTVVCDVTIFKQKITKNVLIGLVFIFAAIVLTNF